MSEVFQSRHPDADQLTAFMEHALPEDARQQTLAHLAVCPDCRMVVMLAAEPVEVAPVDVEGRRWWRVPVWQWGLPVAVAAALVLVTMHRSSVPVVRAPEERAAVTAPAAPLALPAPVPPKVTLRPKAVAVLPAVAPVPVARGMMAGMAGAAPLGQAGRGVGAAAPQPAAASLPMPPAPVAAAPEGLDRVVAAAKVPARHPLPSGLTAVSEAAGAGAMVALDAENHLFVTRDGGAHWDAVEAQWKGKVVQVGLVSSGSGRAIGAMVSMPRAQSTVAGAVTDPAGAAIPGATVTLSDVATKAVVGTAKTDANGRYALASAAGNYQLDAEKAGFSRDQVTIALAPGKPVTANMALAVGAESTAVEVQASNADLQTLNATVAQMLPEANSKSAPLKAMARALPKVEAVFELVTENGEHWVSSDGSTWRKK